MGKKKQLTIQEAGKMGGTARGKKLSKEQLSAIGRKGAAARWAKKGGK